MPGQPSDPDSGIRDGSLTLWAIEKAVYRLLWEAVTDKDITPSLFAVSKGPAGHEGFDGIYTMKRVP